MNDLLKRLNMDNISDLFDEYYEKALKDASTPKWLTKEYVCKACKDCHISDEVVEMILPALSEVKKNSDLVLFSKTLYHMLGIRKHHEEVFGGLTFPKAPEGENPLPYDLFSFFPMLAHVQQAYFELKEKGVPEEILNETYSAVGGSVLNSTKRVGRPSFSLAYFLWTTTQKNASLLRIGRFNFEIRQNCKLKFRAFINETGNIKLLMTEGIQIHKDGFVLGSPKAKDEDGSFITEYLETDEYFEGNEANNETCRVVKKKTQLLKSEWKLFCAPGDSVISVHIPGQGDFEPEVLEKSLSDGRAFLKSFYPEIDFKAFMCTSWLLAPELKDLLKPTSNILDFQNRYSKFPVLCGGLDIFSFVFQLSVSSLSDVDLDLLPQDSSLRRNLITLYKKGDFIHETGGVFPFEKK